MAMTLKVDDNGAAVLTDGKPVYVMEDGKEFTADVPDMYSKITRFKNESKQGREKLEAANTTIGAYQKLFPDMEMETLVEWKEAAEKALELSKNLDDKKLIDAGKAEKVKQDLQEAHDRNLKKVKEQFATEKANLEAIMTKKDSKIFDLTVGNAFANSKFFSGPNPITVLSPDIALSFFGKNFKVVEKESGELQVTGFYGDSEILSQAPDMVGEIAPIDEALQYLIDRYPQKDRILAASGKSGSGAGGGTGGNGGPKDEIAKLQSQWAEALKNGNPDQAVAIKNRLYQLQKTQNQGVSR